MVTQPLRYRFPRMTLDPRLWPAPVPIAHRGSRLLWPENTMEAFEAAVRLGYDHLETDLHITRDGALVCIHDHTVDRTTDGSGPVDSFTLEELQQFDAGFRHRSRDEYRFRSGGVRIPSFEEAVKAFPEARFVVDLKTDGLEEALASLIERHDLAERLIVGSFSDLRLTRFRELTGGRIPTSTGRAVSRLWLLASRLGRRVDGVASALQLPTRMRGVRVVDERLVAAAHEMGLQVHVWTVNRIEDMARYLDIGVDGIVTDRPDLLKSLLIDRGEWRGT